MSFVSIGESL